MGCMRLAPPLAGERGEGEGRGASLDGEEVCWREDDTEMPLHTHVATKYDKVIKSDPRKKTLLSFLN